MVRGIRVGVYGGPEVLRLVETQMREPGEGEVSIQIKAAGVNFVDTYFRSGAFSTKLPFIIGLEGAGVVDSLGTGVTLVKVGDKVAFFDQLGGYAEKIIVPADRLIPIPDRMSFEEAAAFPLQGMTAHFLIHEYKSLKEGDVVLIHAAAGGMGLLLVQWAKHLGARVIGTVSDEKKVELVRKAGADEVILYTKNSFVAEVRRLTGGRGADLIIDGIGKDTMYGDLEICAERGHLIVYGAASGAPEPVNPSALMAKSLSLSSGMLSHYTRTREELLVRSEAVFKGIKEGWLRLTLGGVFPLEEAAEAHRILHERQSVGKLVLKTTV